MAKATAKNLDSIVLKEFDDFFGLTRDVIQEAQKSAAKKAISRIKETAPKQTGKYAKGWKSTTETTRTGTSTTIYNKDAPGLAHLLEHGHALINGGRTLGTVSAKPHLAKAEEEAIEAYQNEIERRIEA